MTETNPKIRKGIKLYLDYFDNEFSEITDEEIGILIYGLYEYDKYGKLTDHEEKINENKYLRMLFKILKKNQDRAVAEWNRKREYFDNIDKNKNKGTTNVETTDKDITNEETHNNEYPYNVEIGIDEIMGTPDIYVFFAKCEKNKIGNLPSDDDLKNIVKQAKEFDIEIDEIHKIIENLFTAGNADMWNRNFNEYVEM